MSHQTPQLSAWPPANAQASRRLLSVETEVVLQADCAAVHAYVTNASRWGEWHPATRSVEAVPNRPLGLGETVLEHISTAGRRFSATWTVVQIDTPHVWVIATDTPQGLARITYRLFNDAGAGDRAATRFRRTLEFRSRPWLLRQFDPWMRRWVLVPQSRRAMDNLKRVLEMA